MIRSHPSWVRGLKRQDYNKHEGRWLVAPLVGAWIETSRVRQQFSQEQVAPLVGAWIETPNAPEIRPYNASHPSWVRGLKQNDAHNSTAAPSVAPLVGAWIETSSHGLVQVPCGSHPSWVRGLKHRLYTHHRKSPLSHPSWVRGLKPEPPDVWRNPRVVAPLVGAWIETRCHSFGCRALTSHPSWVRGLKPACRVAIGLKIRSHPSWVRGLKLKHGVDWPAFVESHPSWVRGLKHLNLYRAVLRHSRTPRGCVD